MQTNNKLRDALSMLVDACDSFHQFIENGLDGHYEAIPRYDGAADDFLRCVSTAKDALAEPVRNYEVGTAQEQAARMRVFCAKDGLCQYGAYRCENCELLYEPSCELAWAQMPYEEGGAK